MNSVAKHTPGPWQPHISEVRGDLCVVSDRSWICGEILNRIRTISEEEATANAYLIAAAPDLLENVEMFERSLVYEIKKAKLAGDSEGAWLKSLTLEMVRQTLAKARGDAHA